MPSIITRGGMSAKALGFGASSSQAVYVEDVFSTYLYSGTGSAQTITNGIDLSTKGGLVWTKSRTVAADHILIDTVNPNNYLSSNLTAAATSGAQTYYIPSYTTTGYNIAAYNYNEFNNSSYTYASWTFRKQPKFFDVVTYTGTGSATTIAHNLGVAPGMIIVKQIDAAGYDWFVYHASIGSGAYTKLNQTDASISDSRPWNNTNPTSSNFTVGSYGGTNYYGGTFIAYLFADSNSGGFGAAGTDSVVACGSYTGTGSAGLSVNLGWEPQFVLIKNITAGGNWFMFDNMRGIPTGGDTDYLFANQTNSEGSALGNLINLTSTGFTVGSWYGVNTNNENVIYLAIRRGPMKTPTDATKVFSPNVSSGAAGTSITTGFPVDTQLMFYRPGGAGTEVVDRLRGASSTSTSSCISLVTSSTAAEYSTTDARNWSNTGFEVSSGWASSSMVYENFRRAPGFFDVVCYTGTGSATTVAHNLGVAPELMIVKGRSVAGAWTVYSSALTLSENLAFNTNAAKATGTDRWNNTRPTSSVFSLSSSSSVNNSTSTYVAYLFATCPGVSKVGSYTGTGAAQNIDCGFAASARFILLKRTDSTGDWYTYDSARGISSSNDPYLLINSSAAEVAGTNYVDAYASGFTLTSSAPAALNANGGSYIFLAIA